MPPNTRGNKRVSKQDIKEQEKINRILDDLIGKEEEIDERGSKMITNDNDTEADLDYNENEHQDLTSKSRVANQTKENQIIFQVNKSQSMLIMNEHDQSLIQMKSKNFTIPFGDLNLRQYPEFMDYEKINFQKLKNWYFNQKKAATKQFNKGIFKVPKIEHPNEILIKLFSNQVEETHRAYLAQLLQENMPHQLQSFYANKELEYILQGISECQDNIEQLVHTLQKAPLHVRLKATARALTLLSSKDHFQDDYKISWFNNCIKPCFSQPDPINYFEFDLKEIITIKELCEFNNPHTLNEKEAFSYLKLLKFGKLFDLDEAYHHFKQYQTEFWKLILVELCQISEDIADIISIHQENMISEAVYKHYKIFSLPIKFAHTISLFQKLPKEELSDLYKMSQQRNFGLIVELLDPNKLHDYHLFKIQSQTYLNLDKPQQIQACQQILQKVPLNLWNTYQDQIMASNAFVESGTSLKIVSEVIDKVMALERLQQINSDIKGKLEHQWREAFISLCQKIALQEFTWQKELVIKLVYLITKLNKKNIAISLGTGHGKSVIIQLLADILSNIDSKVVIVCLNNFLAFWGKTKYGSQNVISKRISYMSLEEFINKEPNPNEHVIFDEVDQMLGLNSLKLIIKGNNVRAVYQASQMKQWKSVIGFSGTISQPTINQIRAELKDPLCFEIPTLRKNGNENNITKVIKTSKDQINQAIIKRIKELSNSTSNFILIVKNKSELEEFISEYQNDIQSFDRNFFVFDQFQKNYQILQKQLTDLRKGNFIILTTLEGSRGVDYKGVNPAHVILGFNPQSYSQCVQALGRGCREITDHAEGTIICVKPLTMDGGEYKDQLLINDGEIAEGLEINCKIARMLHDQEFPKMVEVEEIEQMMKDGMINPDNKDHFTVVYFKTMMERGENIKFTEKGDVLWNALKTFDKSGNMPDDFWQDWNK